MMIGIVDVGGGLRGAYSSGIYDCFLDQDFCADYCLGVSAGSANLITYLAKQRGRTKKFYTEYPHRKEYMSLSSMLKTGSFLSLDYLFTTLSNDDGEDPLDYETFSQCGIPLRIAATRASDGEGCFFTNEDIRKNDYAVLKASCCLPIACKPVTIDGVEYYDGGIAQPIPFQKAFDDGCDKVILVLTKPKEDYFLTSIYAPYIKKLLPKRKEIIALTESLHIRCREAILQAEELEKQGKLIIVEPHDCFGMSTLSREKEPIERLYEEGYKDAERLLDRITDWR